MEGAGTIYQFDRVGDKLLRRPGKHGNAKGDHQDTWRTLTTVYYDENFSIKDKINNNVFFLNIVHYGNPYRDSVYSSFNLSCKVQECTDSLRTKNDSYVFCLVAHKRRNTRRGISDRHGMSQSSATVSLVSPGVSRRPVMEDQVFIEQVIHDR